VTASATLPHAARSMPRARPIAPAAEIDLAVEHLASQIAGECGVRLDALEAICRAVVRLARTRRREVPLDDERPVPVMGSWSLDKGSPHVILGED
jgi:hypothetical protein